MAGTHFVAVTNPAFDFRGKNGRKRNATCDVRVITKQDPETRDEGGDYLLCQTRRPLSERKGRKKKSKRGVGRGTDQRTSRRGKANARRREREGTQTTTGRREKTRRAAKGVSGVQKTSAGR